MQFEDSFFSYSYYHIYQSLMTRKNLTVNKRKYIFFFV